jgi:hypothetical protein
MLSGMRNHVFELMCLRCNTVASQGRGLDDLPPAEQNIAATCIPSSLDLSELKCAFQTTTQALQEEIQANDVDLAARLAAPLNAIAQ